MVMPSMEPILRHAYGYWASAILAASIKQDLFTHLESSPATPDDLAARASITERTAQALLDGLLGMGLVEKRGAQYANSPSASAYLVRGKVDNLGGYAAMILATWRDWEKFPEVVARGRPLHTHENANPQNEFWEDLVPALAPLGFIPARMAAERLQIAGRPSLRMLDIAGGAGAYSAIWLGINPRARAVQLDWPNVNAIAKRYVAGFGVADRFEVIDGDMERVPLEDASYDYVIYSNIAHGISAERNTGMFKKIKRSLRPGGKLIIVGLLPNDDRTGHPLLLMFNANMILNTELGAIHVRSDYTSWLNAAGMHDIEFQSVADVPFTIVYAS